MAAGLSSRFQSNKLLAELDGASLARRALNAVPADKLDKVVVVTCYPELRALAEGMGFFTVWNNRPEAGISFTIRLGLEGLQNMDAAMFMVCDQPLLTRASVSSAVELYRKNPHCIVGLSFDGKRGNPCIFPSAYFPELRALSGDMGGSAVIRKNEASLLLCEAADESELKDVDYPPDLDESHSLPTRNP